MNASEYYFSAEARWDAQVKTIRALALVVRGVEQELAHGPWIVARRPARDANVRAARRQAHLSRALRPRFDRLSTFAAFEKALDKRDAARKENRPYA